MYIITGLVRRNLSYHVNNCVRYEVFTAVTMKNGVFRMLRRVAVVRTDVVDELSASLIRVTRIGDLGKRWL
jgi:hypothetical protein